MNTIPDLWPSDALKVDVRTPVAILRVQASLLQQRTQGLLEAEVITVTGEGSKVGLNLDVIAPALNNYRHRLVSVKYEQDSIYPAIVSAKGLRVRETSTTTSFLGTSRNTSIEVEVNEKKAYSDSDFVRIIQEVLQARETVALLQSLIARSNEQGNGVKAITQGDTEAIEQ